jgi:hypothetical protein
MMQPISELTFAVFARIIDNEIRGRLTSIPGPLLDRDLLNRTATWHTRDAKATIVAISETEVQIDISLREGGNAVDRFIERMAVDHANGLGRDLAVLFSGPGDDAD